MKIIIFYFDNRASKMFTESTNESGQTTSVLSSPNNFVLRNELVARIVDATGPEDAKRYIDKEHINYYHLVPYFQFKIGSGIFFDESTKSYRANHYGFIVLDKVKTMRLIVPFQITKEKTKAFYLIHPAKNGQLPSYSDIEEVLKLNKIVTPVDEKIIREELSKIDPKNRGITRLKVAQSKEPVNGRSEYFTPLVDIGKKAGKMLEDGRMDFKEIDSIVQVTKGQELLRRFEEIKAEDGYDIYGEKAAAVIEESKGFQRGENIVQSGSDPDIYVSAIDGCLETDKKKINVRAVATIKGDVDYESGNIDFSGSVRITGSVKPGFSVKATGDIFIDQSVDDAYLESGGKISVKMGISGKGSAVIKSEGGISAKFVLNSHLESKGDVIIEDSIINSKVYSNSKVFVTSQHGKIMGGEISALYRIEANSAGSSKETNTILTVGRNLELERELETIRIEINLKKESLEEVMTKIKTNFGGRLFEDPKKYIEVLPPIK
ncbi:MAG TPA: FapA family protein, partial [Spirochaetota bacterium]|nr:FapA family protein [Spirochaetota bacterium]